MTANPLKQAAEKPAMELDAEQARYWLASAERRGNPEAAKKWREYLTNIETTRRTGDR